MFARKTEEHGICTVQTLCRQYKPNSGQTNGGLTVWLIGAMHVGSADYYKHLQHRLDALDQVLFEGISNMTGDVTDIQIGLGKLAGLKAQQDLLDYKRPNWKSADIDFKQLEPSAAATMSVIDLLAKSLVKALSNASHDKVRSLIGYAIENMSMFSDQNQQSNQIQPSDPIQQLQQQSAHAWIQQIKPAILTNRNAHLIGELTKTIASSTNQDAKKDSKKDATKDSKKEQSIAVLYGVAHLEAVHNYLVQQLCYKPTTDEWETVFNFKPQRFEDFATCLRFDDFATCLENIHTTIPPLDHSANLNSTADTNSTNPNSAHSNSTNTNTSNPNSVDCNSAKTSL
jgi:hypothetical protein